MSVSDGASNAVYYVRHAVELVDMELSAWTYPTRVGDRGAYWHDLHGARRDLLRSGNALINAVNREYAREGSDLREPHIS